MIYFVVINTFLILVVICQRGIKLSTLRRIEEHMATQEERLQAILAALVDVKNGILKLEQQIADLKVSNPAIEDELSGLESTVADIKSALPAPPEPPTT